MAEHSSLEASISYGIQADKTTQATVFRTGLKTTSSMPPPAKDVYDPGPEHPGPASRNTLRRSAAKVTGYLANFSSEGVFYPNLIGDQLVGAGFLPVSVNNTDHYVHTFKIGAASALKYISVLWTLDTWTRAITGARLTSLGVNITPEEATVSDEGRGLVMVAPVGGETLVPEDDFFFEPTIGTGTFEIAAAAFTTEAIRGLTFDVTQTLDEEDRALFVPGRANLPQRSIDVALGLQDINISQADYQLLVNNGAANTDPYLGMPIMDVDVTFQSASNIAGAAVPYSFQIQIPELEVTMSDFQATGNEVVRYSLEGVMLDRVTDPVVVILTNNVASYA